MADLKEVRLAWEDGLKILFELPVDETMLIVILENKNKNIEPLTEYHLNRYFKIGDKWEISVDVRSINKSDILDHLIRVTKGDFARMTKRLKLGKE